MSKPIQFYVQPDSHAPEYWVYVTSVVATLYRQARPLMIHLPDSDALAELDAYLWQHPGDAYLGHSCQGTSGNSDAPIVLGCDLERPQQAYTLVHLLPTLAEYEENCQLIVEIISQDASSKSTGRERFRQYRQHGYAVSMQSLESET